MVYGNFPPSGHHGWRPQQWSPATSRLSVPFFGQPKVPLGWRTVYCDAYGSLYELPPGAQLDKAVWRYYYLVDGRTHQLALTVESASAASASRFQVNVWTRWRIDVPADFLRSPLEPQGHCRTMIMAILSDITRSVNPDSAKVAQQLVDARRGVGFTIGSGLVVWLDNAVVHPPRGFEELQVELEQGHTQIDVDRLRRLRNNEQRVDDFDFEAVNGESERATRRDRAAAFLDRADDARTGRFPATGGFRRRAELVASEDDLFMTPPDRDPAQDRGSAAEGTGDDPAPGEAAGETVRGETTGG